MTYTQAYINELYPMPTEDESAEGRPQPRTPASPPPMPFSEEPQRDNIIKEYSTPRELIFEQNHGFYTDGSFDKSPEPAAGAGLYIAHE